MGLRPLERPRETAEAARTALAAAEKLPAATEFARNENSGRPARARLLVGRTDDAIATLQRSIEAAPTANQVPDAHGREATLAEVYAETGLARDCVPVQAKRLREPSGITVPMLNVEPAWANLGEDAGFKALLADPKKSSPL